MCDVISIIPIGAHGKTRCIDNRLQFAHCPDHNDLTYGVATAMNLPSRYCSLPAMLVLASGSFLALHAQQTATIEVTAGRSLGPVNRLVFGQNIEAGDNAFIFSSDKTNMDLIQKGDGVWDPAANGPVVDVLNDSKAVKMSMLRYPGGCYAHNFDWRKTVGPDAKKAGWLFGLDEYMLLCRSIGATPLITLSDYALPAEQMPQNAAQLVEYLNSPADPAHLWAMKRKQWGHPEPYNVTWFEIGNESMHGNHRVLPHRQYSADQYADYANATAAAIRKVDPRVKLGIVLMPGAGTDVDCDWNQTVVRRAGASADFAVVHMYAPQGPMTGAPEGLRMQAMVVAPQHIEERLKEYHRMIRQSLGHDLPLGITEFDGTIDQPASSFTLASALECADLLRVFLKPELNVAMANYWDYINSPFSMLRTNLRSPDGRPETQEPAFLLYKLWAEHFGSKLVGVEVDSPRADFAGVGTEPADKSDIPQARRQIQQISLEQYFSSKRVFWNKLPEIQTQQQGSDLTIRLKDLHSIAYQLLATVPRQATDLATPEEFVINFDAQFLPDPGSQTSPMGIGLIDSRGWGRTHSGIGLDGITSELKHFDATYRLTPQTTSVDLSARLLVNGANVSGTLQVRNLKITEFASGHDVAYPLLTGSASVSPDGKTAYLIVFNKSATDSIPTAIHLSDFPAEEARYWEVNGPGLGSSTGVTETQNGTEIQLNTSSTSTHIFPAHSMTAIEFNRMR